MGNTHSKSLDQVAETQFIQVPVEKEISELDVLLLEESINSLTKEVCFSDLKEVMEKHCQLNNAIKLVRNRSTTK